MDPYDKQTAPIRPATNFYKNNKSQSFSSTKSNANNSQAQPEDRFDESSSIGSMSTVGRSTKCLKCKQEARGDFDPLSHPCSKCSARWHFGCHHPPLAAQVTSGWLCARCLKKYDVPSREHSPENGSLGSICEITGCNKTIYSMLGKTKHDRILCKHHEMTEKSERSKLATKAQMSALSRSSSKPIKKSKLYPFKYDQHTQGIKRKPARKPGDPRKAQMSSARSPVRPVFDSKSATGLQGITKLDNVPAARGALHPRTDNSVHIPNSTSLVQPQFTTDSPSTTKDPWAVPKIQNGTIISPSPEYEPPSPAKADDDTNYSPEYEPPSPAKVDKGTNFWQSDIEQDNSPGSQINNEFRAMQESAKKGATGSTDAFFRNSSPPPISLSHSKGMSEPMLACTGNKNPVDKRPLVGSEKVVKASSSTVSSTPSIPAVLSTEALKLIAPMSFLGNMVNNYVTTPYVENDNRDAARLSKKRKASPQEDRNAENSSVKEKGLEQLTLPNINNAMDKIKKPQPPGKSPEPEHTASQLQQQDQAQKEPTEEQLQHTAPLYGDYKPHTIEFRRQLRSKTYDPSVLDHYLSLQMESQARAEVEKEQNLMPQPDVAAKTQIWGNIDPRIVWPKEQPEGWYETKRKEIDARGGKKANFGILLTAQVRKERSDRGWHPNQNRDYVPKDERNGGSIFVGSKGKLGKLGQVELAIRDRKLGVLVPVEDGDGKLRAEKKFLPGDR